MWVILLQLFWIPAPFWDISRCCLGNTFYIFTLNCCYFQIIKRVVVVILFDQVGVAPSFGHGGVTDRHDLAEDEANGWKKRLKVSVVTEYAYLMTQVHTYGGRREGFCLPEGAWLLAGGVAEGKVNDLNDHVKIELARNREGWRRAY